MSYNGLASRWLVALGSLGVRVFFIISGFLVVLENNNGHLNGAGHRRPRAC
jgi:peptidoglycan/LPS O-acetylase OafA/YrhL